jgi:uncharacterized protein (DUF736 family)
MHDAWAIVVLNTTREKNANSYLTSVLDNPSFLMTIRRHLIEDIKKMKFRSIIRKK